MVTLFFCPKLSAETGQFLYGYKPQVFKVSITLSLTSFSSIPLTLNPNATSSKIIVLDIIWFGFWRTTPISSPLSLIVFPSKLFPSNIISPFDSLKKPHISLDIVDLPAPFFPTTLTISPLLILKLISLNISFFLS